MDENEHVKEVYAHYGLALYQVQCLERALCILLASEKAPSVKSITKYDYDNILNTLFKNTLGGLIRKMQKDIKITDDFEKNIEKALEKRNRLTHNYFWERAGHFMTAEGRNFMLKELQEVSSFFEGLDNYLVKITDEWAKKNGLTAEFLEKQMTKLIKNARIP